MKRPLSIAHRGASGHEPENTMAAFEKALAMGCSGIELDVKLSADGVPVVLHDESLARLTSLQANVADLKISELRSLKVAGKHRIPLLEEVLEIVSGRCLLNVEIKAAAASPIVGKMIAKQLKVDQVIVSSFDWNVLKAISEEYPTIPVGVLTMTDLPLAIDFAKFIRAKAVHPHYHLLSKQNVKSMQSDGFLVNCWTVNDPGDIGELKNFGVDGIITDYPERV